MTVMWGASMQLFGSAMCSTGMRGATFVALGAVCGVLISACGPSSTATTDRSRGASSRAPARTTGTSPGPTQARTTGTSPGPTQARTPPSAPPSSRHASAGYTGSGTAHGCGRITAPIATLTVNPDGLAPSLGCFQLKPGQRLRVVNNTDGFGQHGEAVTLALRGLPTITVARGKSIEYPRPISAYLAVGQHYGSCSSEPGSQFELWVLP
jgi:hypothetical protein